MSKKNRGEKESTKLRREVEILKAQLKAVRPEWERVVKEEVVAVTKNPADTNARPDYKAYRPAQVTADFSYLHRDLLKTVLLSAAAFASIFLIYFYQGRADQILKLFHK